jgi:hypothetical protein
MTWFKSLSKSIFYIPLWIFIAKELEAFFQIIGWNFYSRPDGSSWFISNFIEWFGVLYGILLPLILVKAWEQLDTIDRQFDREADSVKILYKDLSYLSDQRGNLGIVSNKSIKLLHKYVNHVIEHHKDEIKQSKNNNGRKDGDKILENIRGEFKGLIYLDTKQAALSTIIVSELFERLNELTDNRGDRISHASQRLFENLRTIALIASIIFLIPFYFAGPVYFSTSFGPPYFYLLDIALVLAVTFLVIYIYMIIEDLDDPFTGPKRMSDESWQLIREEITSDQKEREQKVIEGLVDRDSMASSHLKKTRKK